MTANTPVHLHTCTCTPCLCCYLSFFLHTRAIGHASNCCRLPEKETTVERRTLAPALILGKRPSLDVLTAVSTKTKQTQPHLEVCGPLAAPAIVERSCGVWADALLPSSYNGSKRTAGKQATDNRMIRKHVGGAQGLRQSGGQTGGTRNFLWDCCLFAPGVHARSMAMPS